MSHKTERENQLEVTKIRNLFQEEDLTIVPVVNLKIINFLDVTLDVIKDEYRPYNKPNNDPLYVHSNSNHPPNIIKQIPKTVERRLSDLSSSERVFENEKGLYVEALKRSGYNVNLTYNPSPPKKKVRSRKVTWFNPPFCRSIKTKIGQTFLSLIS